MSAEYDVHAETESEDGDVSLAKVASSEVDIDTLSDTTPTSQDSGASSSSSANGWGETLSSSVNGFNGHVDLVVEHQQTSTNEVLHDSMTIPFSVPQVALSTTSTPISEAPHNLEASFTSVDAGFSTHGDPYEAWTDQPDSLADIVLPSNGIQPPYLFSPQLWPGLSEMPGASSEPLLPTATDTVTPTEHPEPAADTFEDEIVQDASQSLLEDHSVLAEGGHTDGSDEDWLGLSEDSYNIFSSDFANGNGTLHTLNTVSYYEDDDVEEQSTFFSVSFFFYYWKQMYTSRKRDYPRISELANHRVKVQRPDKVTAQDIEQCDYQGIHWSRFQTTKQKARDIRRMTYRNLRNCGPSEQNFGTKAFQARFPGAVIPSRDCYFNFNEMDMNRRPDYAHYQLRHNLSATSKNAIFYTYRSSRQEMSVWEAWKLQLKTVVCFNPETGTEICALDVSKKRSKEDPRISKIHTLTAGNGVLVAGSYEGVYAMKSLSADFASAPVIGSIAIGQDVSTNHIHTNLDRQSGLPRAIFDSNDRSVRILDCTTNHWVACHKYPYQVNCSVTSPDGRLRLLNGDGCEPIVANAETGETLAKLPGHDDFGFACDWAADGITMATGHQDGLVKVWDARQLNQSIQTIAMEQAGCRSLQFSPLGSGKRVLVLAEPADFVHIVDAQTFESKQTIDFFGEISGISMPPDGSKLYIANADAKYGGLIEFTRSRGSSKYNRQPLRIPELEDEHEEMVDSIVNGEQPVRQFLKPGDKLEVKPLREKGFKECQRLLIEYLKHSDGRTFMASREWLTAAGKFGIPSEEAVSFGQLLYENMQAEFEPDDLAVLFEPMIPERQQAGRRGLNGAVASESVTWNRLLNGQRFLHLGEEGYYRREDTDPRRKGFKIGRKSESVDWLSESEMEDDGRVNVPQGRRQWGSRYEIDDDVVM